MWCPMIFDNVRLRYLGSNNAKAYAAGLELRLFGQLVKRRRELDKLWPDEYKRKKLRAPVFYNYKLDSLNQPVDSTLMQQGWVRRPTDRLLTFGMFFQDYLSTNKNFKMYLNTLYGSKPSVQYTRQCEIPECPVY